MCITLLCYLTFNSEGSQAVGCDVTTISPAPETNRLRRESKGAMEYKSSSLRCSPSNIIKFACEKKNTILATESHTNTEFLFQDEPSSDNNAYIRMNSHICHWFPSLMGVINWENEKGLTAI